MINKNILSLFILSTFIISNVNATQPFMHRTQPLTQDDIERLTNKRVNDQIDAMKNKAVSLKNRIAALEDKRLQQSPDANRVITIINCKVASLEGKLALEETKRNADIKAGMIIGTVPGILLGGFIITHPYPDSYYNQPGTSRNWDMATNIGMTAFSAALGAIIGFGFADTSTIVERAHLAENINRHLLMILNVTEGKRLNLTPEQLESSTITLF